jgi:hypothetical protein
MLGFERYFSNACLPINKRPVAMSFMGQGVLANAIALNTRGSEHITDIPETCSPNPPTCCGAPIRRASLRLLQWASCSIVPRAIPNRLTWKPLLDGMRQLSFPPPPIIVGAMAVGTGLPVTPCPPLLVTEFDVLVLLLSTLDPAPMLVLRSPVTSWADAALDVSRYRLTHMGLNLDT